MDDSGRLYPFNRFLINWPIKSDNRPGKEKCLGLDLPKVTQNSKMKTLAVALIVSLLLVSISQHSQGFSLARYGKRAYEVRMVLFFYRFINVKLADIFTH